MGLREGSRGSETGSGHLEGRRTLGRRRGVSKEARDVQLRRVVWGATLRGCQDQLKT